MPLHSVDGYVFFLFILLFCSGGIAAFAGFLESSLEFDGFMYLDVRDGYQVYDNIGTKEFVTGRTYIL